MRRLAPRPLGAALEELSRDVAPAGLLAEVQSRWGDATGAVVAAESEPVSERDGAITVRCSSAVWAQELELLSRDLLDRLNAAIEGPGKVQSLRFVVTSRRS